MENQNDNEQPKPITPPLDLTLSPELTERIKKRQIETKALNYLPAFTITSVACESCKHAIQPQQAQIAVDIISLQNAALHMHNSSGVICGTPRLIINYLPAMIDERILNGGN